MIGAGALGAGTVGQAGAAQDGNEAYFYASLDFPTVYRADGTPKIANTVCNAPSDSTCQPIHDRPIVLPSRFSDVYNHHEHGDVYNVALPYQLQWNTNLSQHELRDVRLYVEFETDAGGVGRGWPAPAVGDEDLSTSTLYEWEGDNARPQVSDGGSTAEKGHGMTPAFQVDTGSPVNAFRPVDATFWIDFSSVDAMAEDEVEMAYRFAVPNDPTAGLTELIEVVDYLWESTIETADRVTRLPLDKFWKGGRLWAYSSGAAVGLIDPSDPGLEEAVLHQGISGFNVATEEIQIDDVVADTDEVRYAGPAQFRLPEQDGTEPDGFIENQNVPNEGAVGDEYELAFDLRNNGGPGTIQVTVEAFETDGTRIAVLDSWAEDLAADEVVSQSVSFTPGEDFGGWTDLEIHAEPDDTSHHRVNFEVDQTPPDDGDPDPRFTGEPWAEDWGEETDVGVVGEDLDIFAPWENRGGTGQVIFRAAAFDAETGEPIEAIYEGQWTEVPAGDSGTFPAVVTPDLEYAGTVEFYFDVWTEQQDLDSDDVAPWDVVRFTLPIETPNHDPQLTLTDVDVLVAAVGESTTATVDFENAGGDGERDLELRALDPEDGDLIETLGSTTLAVDALEEGTVDVEVTPSIAAGTVTIQARLTGGTRDTVETSVTIEDADPELAIGPDDVDWPATASVDEPVSVTVSFSNEGGHGTPGVALEAYDGAGEYLGTLDETPLDVEPDESGTVELSGVLVAADVETVEFVVAAHPGDEVSRTYDVGGDGVSCEVLDDGTEVCDVNGDGYYRDVNADGVVSQTDVTEFFNHQHREAWDERTDLFDYDDNGDVGHGDVIALFEYVALN